MIGLFLKLTGVSALVVVAAATGITFDNADIENQGVKSAVIAWNDFAEAVHEFVVGHDDQIKDISKKAAAGLADTSIEALGNITEFVDHNKDAIQD